MSQKALCRAMLLTPYLPSVLLRHRLKTHTTVIHQLDKALAKLGVGQLTAQEVKSVSASLQYQPVVLDGLSGAGSFQGAPVSGYIRVQALHFLISFLHLFSWLNLTRGKELPAVILVDVSFLLVLQKSRMLHFRCTDLDYIGLSTSLVHQSSYRYGERFLVGLRF